MMTKQTSVQQLQKVRRAAHSAQETTGRKLISVLCTLSELVCCGVNMTSSALQILLHLCSRAGRVNFKTNVILALTAKKFFEKTNFLEY